MLSKKNSKIRCAIVGVGRIAYLLQKDKLRNHTCTHLEAVFKNSEIEIVALCDKKNIRCERIFFEKNLNNIKTFYDYHEMIQNVDFEILIIASDSYTHMEIVEFALRKCIKLKAIVCEKPLGIDFKSCNKITSLLKARNISFYLNHTRRWNINYKKVKKVIDENLLGKLKQIDGFICAGGQKVNGEGPILHDGTHLIDGVNFFTDSYPDYIFADVVYDKEVEKDVNVFFKTKNNIDVYMNLSCDKNFFYFQYSLYFTNGKINIGNGIFEIFEARPSKNYTGFVELEKVDQKEFFKDYEFNNINFFEGLYKDVTLNIKNGIVNNQNFFDGLLDMYIIDSIFESGEKKKRIPFNPEFLS